MNILLIRPRPDKRSINLQSFMICEPLELEYTAAFLEKRGHSVDIADMILERKPLRWFLKRKEYAAVGFTAYLPHIAVVKRYAAEVKAFRADIITVVGGVHAEVVPQDFEFPEIDFILKARGMESFAEVLDRLGENHDSIRRQVAGIWAGAGKDYPVPSGTGELFPDRTKTARYRDRYNYIYHNRCATIKTSYGCPYQCDFCFCTKVTDGRYFTRDLDSVVMELEQIEEQNVFIVDDDFLLDTERIRRFCSLLDEKNIRKNYIMFGRADFVTEHEEEVALLAGHGLVGLFIGIESFRGEDLKSYRKQTTVEMNVRAVRTLEKLGVECYSGIIVGKDWTKRDFDGLIDFLNGFEHPMVNIQPITPIPGTPLFEREKETLSLPRERYELWDMAHLAFTPTMMSERQYYYHILRAYLKTCANKKARKYIRAKYGRQVYRRTLKGAVHIAWQYIKLCIGGNGVK